MCSKENAERRNRISGRYGRHEEFECARRRKKLSMWEMKGGCERGIDKVSARVRLVVHRNCCFALEINPLSLISGTT